MKSITLSFVIPIIINLAFKLRRKWGLSSRKNYALLASIVFIGFIWITWLTVHGIVPAIANLIKNWSIAVTMIFGSMVAGGTSMGGGAVAFPVFTKILGISPYEAKVFSLAIQSIGMTSASIMILALRIKVEWKLIVWVTLGGVLGILLSILYIFPIMVPGTLKIIFSSMVGMFALVMVRQNKRQQLKFQYLLQWGSKERAIFFVTGFFGGIISGLVGNGIDVVSFTVMVLLFRLCEKRATPNAVILMAINAVIGFAIHFFIVRDFTAPITAYWSAAAPVVVLGAPLGAIICNFISPRQVVRILLTLISLEVLFTLLLVEQSSINLLTFLVSSCIFSLTFIFLSSNKHYRELRQSFDKG